MRASVIIPAKDENRNLKILLKKMKRLYNNKYEIIVVDDVKSLNRKITYLDKNSSVKVIRNINWKGKGYALKLGFQEAANDIAVVMDSDLSHMPEHLERLLEPLKNKKVGVVIGSRALGGSDEYNPIRTIGNAFLTGLFNLFFNTNLFDSINGYKAIRKSILADLKNNDMEIEFEILAKCLKTGYRIVEVPSHEMARAYGKAKLKTVEHGFKFFKQILIEGIKYRLRI